MKQRKPKPPVEAIWLKEVKTYLTNFFGDEKRVWYTNRSSERQGTELGWVFNHNTRDVLLDILEQKLDITIWHIETWNPDEMIGIIKELVEGDPEKAKQMADEWWEKTQ